MILSRYIMEGRDESFSIIIYPTSVTVQIWTMILLILIILDKCGTFHTEVGNDSWVTVHDEIVSILEDKTPSDITAYIIIEGIILLINLIE